MSNQRKDHLGASSSEPLRVIIIGNGPSGICLSYLLSGYTPYVRPDAIHPHPLLQRKLSEAPGVSIMDQDLDYLSEGLEGRCQSPVALLFDALLRPDTDFGGSVESVLTWRHQKERAIPHLVLGRNPPGGAWHSIEGSMVTLSQGEWMGLPDLQVKDWMCKKRRGLRNSRATAGDIAHYYRDYVIRKGLSHNFVSSATVTAVEWGTPEPSSPGARDPSPLFQVSGFVTAEDQSQQSFSLRAHNVVLATGTSDSPARLGIPGEALPFVHHDLSALEAATQAGTVSPSSDPVLIIGAGLSAADAVLYARHYSVPVIHAFRRPVDDPGLVFNQLPKMLYPEYHKVHQMMREQSILSPSPYEGYRSLPEHQLLLLKEDRQAVFRDPQGLQKVFGVALVLVLIGSHPDLSFLPGAGTDLAVDPDQPLSAKRNPIEVDPFTYQTIHQEGLYAMGPLAGDNFVRFVQGGALAVASSLLRKEARKPP
ncbi:oxidative stress-induced growth inhibitor 1 isoform X2 [Bos taurus]|nr:oxidative stress-induced growth inhibitor 1 [Bos taurus]XP_024834384.1 oxidative stress-induced growth inhibitor 1 isoform X2 [Bos taurus]XP_059732996.1 oxidative stress-induced growth inhibitor 1 isoform X2 [Bos taurus]AAI12572.1 Oxidative stress induced growth inhibitor 1 [Bos taurus]DAA20318.1 TPA: oxidative stress induced growth inhibitor 1 [Bos taurus]